MDNRLPLTIAISFVGLLGIAGIYARQVGRVGWWVLGALFLLSLWFVLVTGFTFFEGFILSLLARDSPRFAESFLGIFTGSVGEVNVVLLATVWSLLGVAYILGDLLFSIATFRAAILSRRAAAFVGFGLPGVLSHGSRRWLAPHSDPQACGSGAL